MLLNWKLPEISDRHWVAPLLPPAGIEGCDVSFASIFLWRKMFGIQIAQYKKFVLRKINDRLERNGYGFPLGSGDLYETIEVLKEDAEKCGSKLELYAVTEAGKTQLETLFPGQFEFSCYENAFDYIFVRKHIAELVGRKYHKIRNHISQFNRQFPEAVIRDISKNNLNDAAEVQRLWLEEHKDIMPGKWMKTQDFEHLAFTDAIAHFEELQLHGMILYCEKKPAAICIASAINSEICDVHFEKAIKPYSDFGAYAAIRRHLAESLNTFQWVNLEEDMGHPGLRQAKHAWQPTMLLQKYTAVFRV